MRFHLFMLLIVILVSLGMHGMASAATQPVAGAGNGQRVEQALHCADTAAPG